MSLARLKLSACNQKKALPEMDRLGTDTMLHVVKHLAERAPRDIADYRLFRLEEPCEDGKLQQQRLSPSSADTLQSLLSHGYIIIKVDWRPIPEGRTGSELWAHVVLYA